MQTFATEAPAMPRRDITIDFLRGLALAVMTVDHLRNHWLTFFTYQAAGFFCAAFVFVFLSGYVTGKVYSRYLLQDGFRVMLRRIWARSGKLYGVQVLIGVTLILGGQFVPSLVAPFGREVELLASSPLEALAATLLLMPCAPVLDILPMYVVFLAAAPFALSAFYKGRAKLVLLAGSLIWAAAQCGYSLPLPPFGNGVDGASWQFLFLLALYLGYRQQVQPFEKPAQTHQLNLALFGCMVALFLLRHAEVFDLIRFREAIPVWWTDKVHCGPLSLLNLLLWVAFFWLVPAPLSALARQGRVFVAMGRNSLAVFVWHTVLVYAFMALFPGLQRLSILGQALVVALAVVCLVFPLSVTVHKRLPSHAALFTV